MVDILEKALSEKGLYMMGKTNIFTTASSSVLPVLSVDSLVMLCLSIQCYSDEVS